jgi:hypothetical protein
VGVGTYSQGMEMGSVIGGVEGATVSSILAMVDGSTRRRKEKRRKGSALGSRKNAHERR